MKYLALILFVAACGSKAPATSTTAQPTATALPDLPFEQLDHEQRAEFMKQKVMPAMEPIFKNHNPDKFAEFTCVTCHGKQAKDGHFDMPSTELPKLNFKDTSKFKKEDLEWMSTQVKPEMAKLLGLPEFDPANPDPKAFGCQNCHVIEG